MYDVRCTLFESRQRQYHPEKRRCVHRTTNIVPLITASCPTFASMLSTLLSWFVEWDRSLFVKLNSEWTNPLFDAVMPWLRHSAIWAPLYLFILFFVVLNFKTRSSWWILFFITTVALTDMTGTYVFKHNFERFRPCSGHDIDLYVRLLLEKCSGGYGFVSNHAANHFGMAAFFYFSFRKIIPHFAWLGFVWAGLIAYAQVYVGVHYPLDVICGALLGIFSGLFTGYIFNKRFGFAIFENQPIVAS
jgi:membrane-associated phospholipid phosphatase